jgi:hypothetical protein
MERADVETYQQHSLLLVLARYSFGISVFLIGLGFCSAGADVNLQANEVSPDDFVLVRRIIDTRYYDFETPKSTPEEVEGSNEPYQSGVRLRPSLSLGETLEAGFAREVKVEKNDGVSNVVFREYGFGQKNASKAYAEIEKKIVQLNGLDAQDKVILAGSTIKIPAAPKIALERPNPNNANNLIPRISVYPRLQEVVYNNEYNFESMAIKSRPIVLSREREGSPLVFQYVWLPRSFNEQRLKKILPSEKDETQSEILTVNTGSTSPGDNVPVDFVSVAEKAIIIDKFSTPAFQQSVLIILDDGWPSNEAYRESIAFFADAFERIHEKFRYPIGKTKELLSSQLETDYPKSVFHSLYIQQSLQALVDLESGSPSGKKVKVVYLPLSVAQKNSRTVLEDLIALRILDDGMLTRRGDAVPKENISNAQRISKDIVGRLKSDFGIPELRTDKAVIESLLLFVDLYSQATGVPYVVNFSWTTPRLQSKFASFSFNQGVLVSAAGNGSLNDCTKCRPYLAGQDECKCAENAAAKEQLFATRSVEGQDVIAVMNTTRDGHLQCRSSIVGSKRTDPLAFSMDGTVSKDVCGTSFSAPRIAWLLAAKLAYTDLNTLDPPGPDRGIQLRDIFRQARVGGMESGERFNLDIKKLFK